MIDPVVVVLGVACSRFNDMQYASKKVAIDAVCSDMKYPESVARAAHEYLERNFSLYLALQEAQADVAKERRAA